MDRIGIIMHGVTGRMGYNQHLVRSILAIRDQGGIELPSGRRLQVDPIIVGRNAEKMEALAKKHGIARWSTDLDAALADPDDTIFFDAGTTLMRADLLSKALDAGKHVYSEKPISDDLGVAVALAKKARNSGLKHGVVQDKLFLPGLQKLRILRDSGFFGRMLSVRCEFGYWVFEGDWGVDPQRPSWNYRKGDGGGIILDMLCHWRYVMGAICAHHICDWLVPTQDLLNDRGMMGDGAIDLPGFRAMIEAAGFDGAQEVEIFSDRWWSRPGDEVIATCIERFRTVC